MVTGLDGVPLWDPAASILFSTSNPSETFPNTTCLPSSQLVFCVSKNTANATYIVSLDYIIKCAFMERNKYTYVKAQEELGSIGVGSRIGHGKNSRTIMLMNKVLIRNCKKKRNAMRQYMESKLEITSQAQIRRAWRCLYESNLHFSP